MNVDRGRLVRLLTAVEAAAEAAGWDADPAVHVLYDRGDVEAAALFDTSMAANPALGPPVTDRGGWASQPMLPLGKWATAAGVEPVEAVANFARNVAYAPDDDNVRLLAAYLTRPAVLGFALICETWTVSGGRPDVARAVFGEFGHVADMPGAAEARLVVAQDVAGGRYRVARRRGQRAEVAGEEEEWAGGLTAVVGLLCDAITGAVPADPRARYPTLRQVFGGT